MCNPAGPTRSQRAPRIVMAGRNLIYEGVHGQYAYPDGDHYARGDQRRISPVYAIIVRRKPHAPSY